jgi:hypothetical protein
MYPFTVHTQRDTSKAHLLLLELYPLHDGEVDRVGVGRAGKGLN